MKVYDPKAKVMALYSLYCESNLTIQQIWNRFFYRNVKGDVEEFIKKCDQYQKQRKI